MYNNISKKLKIVAKIYFWVSVALSIILACTLGINHSHYMFRSETTVNVFLPIFLICGPAFGYLTSLLIYGLGQLIDNTAKSDDVVSTKAKVEKVEVNEKKPEKVEAEVVENKTEDTNTSQN